MSKGLILAVGLDIFMADFLLREISASHVAFLTTEATLPIVTELIERHKINSSKICFIKDIFSTGETVQEFLNSFRWMKGREGIDEIIVDATNCITVVEMATYLSASLLDLYGELLNINLKLTQVYVHAQYTIGDNGVNHEIPGTEEIVVFERPIDSLGFVLLLEGVRFFNDRLYNKASETFSHLSTNGSGHKSKFAQGLYLLADGYDQWDKMNYESASKLINDAFQLLDKERGFHAVSEILKQLKDNLEALKLLCAGDEASMIFDLCSNAGRREAEGRYDDSLARLYACIERILQVQLKKWGIDTSEPDYSKLPDASLSCFKKELGSELPVELELKKSALLLSFLDDPIGRAVKDIGWRPFIGLLGMRNNSILAHGFRPIGDKEFKKFYANLFLPLWSRFIENIDQQAVRIDSHNHLSIADLDQILYRRITDSSSVVVRQSSVMSKLASQH